jgi:hypothetical protein
LLLLKEVNQPVSVFDDFGHYVRPVTEVGESFSLSGNIIIYPFESKIRMYNITDQKYLDPIIPDQRITDNRLIYFANKFYVSDQKGVYIIYP